jgi:hypothetical protein
MDLKDIDINNISSLLSQIQTLADKQMSLLSEEDKKKVNNIVNAVDLSSIEDMEKSINDLKTK